MKPDYDSLTNAGLSKEEIAKISGCEDQETQIKILRRTRETVGTLSRPDLPPRCRAGETHKKRRNQK